MMHGLFQSFQDETKCFQAGEKKTTRWLKELLFFMDVSVFLSSHWVSGQVGGGALPVFLVLNFNTNEEKLVMRAFREEHSVKTAARVSMGIG